MAGPAGPAGLADRARLRAAVASPTTGGGRQAVVGLRAVGLRELNREHGEESGDALLAVAAQALVAAVGDGYPTGRLSGATLAAVVPVDEVAGVLVRLRQALAVRGAGAGLRAASLVVPPDDPAAALVAIEDALRT
jgi:predicted signal transduction protein with EAL and GGDEF domain